MYPNAAIIINNLEQNVLANFNISSNTNYTQDGIIKLYNHHFIDKNVALIDKISKINNLISKHEELITNPLLEYLNKNVPAQGLQTEFKSKKIINLAQEFYELSKKGLIKRERLSKNGEFDETIHMKGLEDNLQNGCSPADCLINKFNTTWDRSTKPIYKELIF